VNQMKPQVYFLTDTGARRESNQDSCLANEGLGLYVVADGMGGHSGGEVASLMAVKTVEDVVSNPDFESLSPREIISKAYQDASQRIFDRAAEAVELSGMGTTMVLALLRANRMYAANVGDSRIYLFKKPFLWQITEDHSLINEQIRAGVLNLEDARHFVGRNVITRSVGYERFVLPDIIEREVYPGETYLLCSDGLSGLVTDPKICEILVKNSPDKVPQVCVQQAIENGGDDNVTVMVVHFPES
jgi:serine/threonine protein phosphatase PrpC